MPSVHDFLASLLVPPIHSPAHAKTRLRLTPSGRRTARPATAGRSSDHGPARCGLPWLTPSNGGRTVDQIRRIGLESEGRDGTGARRRKIRGTRASMASGSAPRPRLTVMTPEASAATTVMAGAQHPPEHIAARTLTGESSGAQHSWLLATRGSAPQTQSARLAVAARARAETTATILLRCGTVKISERLIRFGLIATVVPPHFGAFGSFGAKRQRLGVCRVQRMRHRGLR